FRITNGLPDEAIRALRFDREGNLWVGTRNGGLVRLSQRLVTAYGTEHGLRFPYVRSVYEDTSGKIWVATEGGGIMVGLEGRWRPWTDRMAESLNPFSYSIVPTHDQRFWLGGYQPWLACLQGDRVVKLYDAGTGLRGLGVQALCEDGGGALWIAYQ